jgi:glutamate synthase domain-containing protein 3
MSGGIAFVLDAAGAVARPAHPPKVDLEPLDRIEDIDWLITTIRRHMDLTGSELGARVLRDWDALAARWVKVMPRDYKRVLDAQAVAAAAGRAPSFTELVGAGVGG